MNYAKRLRNLKITRLQSRYTPTLLFQMYKETNIMANGIRKTQDEFVSEINKINPDIEVLGEYVNAFTKIKCRCKLCGAIFDIVPANIVHRNNISCPTCSDGISYPNKFVRNVLGKLHYKI